MTNTVPLYDIITYCNDLLEVKDFKDASFNGLQVEGVTDIAKIVTGVTANVALFKRAKEVNADLVLTHHGLYWKGDDPRLIGVLGKRVKALAHMSLGAYHLPLDAHLQIGNNALLIQALGAQNDGFLTPDVKQSIAMIASFKTAIASEKVTTLLADALLTTPFVMGPKRDIKRLAVCSGEGGFLLEEELVGIDAVITGEVHERHFHLAEERSITTFCCGHHRTECSGIKALGEMVSKQFGIVHEFINIDCVL